MLNGKELVAKAIITNVPEENIAQHGIDLNLIKVERLEGLGIVPRTGKTQLVQYVEEQIGSIAIPNPNDPTVPIDCDGWNLAPGTYSVTFDQGCKIPADQMLLIRQRSSLLRNGTILHSSVFDAGFQTKNIGTVMIVTHPIVIEYKARIAQIYNHQCTPVENLYEGQFQQDSQRDKK